MTRITPCEVTDLRLTQVRCLKDLPVPCSPHCATQPPFLQSGFRWGCLNTTCLCTPGRMCQIRGRLKRIQTLGLKISFKMAGIYMLQLSCLEAESKLLHTCCPHPFACNCTATSVAMAKCSSVK